MLLWALLQQSCGMLLRSSLRGAVLPATTLTASASLHRRSLPSAPLTLIRGVKSSSRLLSTLCAAQQTALRQSPKRPAARMSQARSAAQLLAVATPEAPSLASQPPLPPLLDALPSPVALPAAATPRPQRASRAATKVSAASLSPALDAVRPPAVASAAATPTSPQTRRRQSAPKAAAAAAEPEQQDGAGAGAAAGPSSPPVAGRKRGRPPKRALEPDLAAEPEEEAAPAKRRTRRHKAAAAASPAVEADAGAEGEGAAGRTRRGSRGAAKASSGEGEEAGPGTDKSGGEKAPQRAKRVRRPVDPLPFTDPTPELLAGLAGYQPPPLPVPNLGYACLNMQLRELKPPIFTSRDCMKRTLDAKGLPYIGELAAANVRDLARIIQHNQEQGIRLFRLSSVLFPWMGTYKYTDLPKYQELADGLKFAGDLARAYGQRLTFHPSHFVKLAAPDAALVQKSINELEAHSEIFDLMGYPPSPENKINIHVGGQYGDKDAAIRRFADNFRRLSPACRARLTVENDDVATSYSLEDLLELHRLTRAPLVFDFHHHRFCPGGLSERAALEAAIMTWPAGVRPVVHWSESQPGRKPHAHSDYVRGPIFLHGREADIDVMIEAKCKERALLAYRDGLPIPEPPAVGAGEEEEEGCEE